MKHQMKTTETLKSKIKSAPASVNAELMTDAEIYEKLKEGLVQAEQGKVYDAAEVFDALRKKFSE